MPFDSLKRKLKQLPDLETMETLAEPSIMDEHIKETDPEQYADIERARNLKMALDSGLGGIGGSVKVLGDLNPESIQLEKWLKLRKELDPGLEQRIKDVTSKPIIDEQAERLTPEQIQQFRESIYAPHNEAVLFEKLRKRLKGEQ